MARMWIGCGSCRWRSVLSMPGMRIVRVPGMGWGWRSHLVAGMRVGCIGLRHCGVVRGMRISGLCCIVLVVTGMRILRGGVAGSQRQGDEQQGAWRRLHGCTLTSRIIPFSMW